MYIPPIQPIFPSFLQHSPYMSYSTVINIRAVTSASYLTDEIHAVTAGFINS